MHFPTLAFTFALTTMVAYSHGATLTTPHIFGQLGRRSLSSDATLPQLFRREPANEKPNSYYNSDVEA
ncbi:hypothetical protein H4R33_002937, partial [Dimargaris cristalligena]